jgi:hypothetical protein
LEARGKPMACWSRRWTLCRLEHVLVVNRYRLILISPGILRLLPRSWRTFIRNCTSAEAELMVNALNAWGIEAHVELAA